MKTGLTDILLLLIGVGLGAMITVGYFSSGAGFFAVIAVFTFTLMMVALFLIPHIQVWE